MAASTEAAAWSCKPILAGEGSSAHSAWRAACCTHAPHAGLGPRCRCMLMRGGHICLLLLLGWDGMGCACPPVHKVDWLAYPLGWHKPSLHNPLLCTWQVRRMSGPQDMHACHSATEAKMQAALGVICCVGGWPHRIKFKVVKKTFVSVCTATCAKEPMDRQCCGRPHSRPAHAVQGPSPLRCKNYVHVYAQRRKYICKALTRQNLA